MACQRPTPSISLGAGALPPHPKPIEIRYDVGLKGKNAPHSDLLVNLLTEDHSRSEKDGKHRLVIEGYGYRWYRVGGLDYLLRRTEIDT